MKPKPRVAMLAWESPWPGYSGCALRQQGLLIELARHADVDLVVLTGQPLAASQRAKCLEFAATLTEVPLRTRTLRDRLGILGLAFWCCMPFHSAMVRWSVRGTDLCHRLLGRCDLVYCSTSHWGGLAQDRQVLDGWILDQHNADVDFWRVYAREGRSLPLRLAAAVNTRLAAAHFRNLYPRVSRVVCVSEEDRVRTVALAPQCQAVVIENGVDCAYFAPQRKLSSGRKRLLFTGTDTGRNMKALTAFMGRTLPRIRSVVPGVEFVIGGSFGPASQRVLNSYGRATFTGPVPDLRPWYDSSDVFVAPFSESYGSKLKISQALAMGICVVTTKAAARGFPLIDGQSAHIVDDQNDSEFARKTIDALVEPLARESIGKAGREIALRHLDWTVLGETLNQCLLDSASQPSRAAGASVSPARCS